jgi:hypothetical protein
MSVYSHDYHFTEKAHIVKVINKQGAGFQHVKSCPNVLLKFFYNGIIKIIILFKCR